VKFAAKFKVEMFGTKKHTSSAKTSIKSLQKSGLLERHISEQK